jgi:regulatory protein
VKEPRKQKPPRSAGPAPNEADLRDAALAHLARFGTTEAGLRRVLERRVDRWARRAEAEGQAAAALAPARATARAHAATVAKAMVALGTVDDAAFAASRARRLARSGRSRRAIAAHLGAKGVGREQAAEALPQDAESEIAAALVQCRRRRIGPFATGAVEPPARQKALAALARAGFPRDVAEAALDMAPEEADMRVNALRQG